MAERTGARATAHRHMFENSVRSATQKTQAPARADRAAAYIPFHLRTLRVGSAPPFDLYMRWKSDCVLYRHRSLPFDGQTLAGLLANQVDTLYVREDEAPVLWAYCEEHLDSVLAAREIPVEQRALSAIRVAERLARDVLAGPLRASVHRAHRFANSLATFVLDTPESELATSRLIELLSDGSTLAVHSANTAVIAASLGRFAPDLTPQRVAELAVAGLLHDIGLTLVPDEILYKPSALTSDERELIEAHPATGEEILRQVQAAPEAVVAAVRWHHERLDGSGYPDGIRPPGDPLERARGGRGRGLRRTHEQPVLSQAPIALSSHAPDVGRARRAVGR
jgi:hypothetical protein